MGILGYSIAEMITTFCISKFYRIVDYTVSILFFLTYKIEFNRYLCYTRCMKENLISARTCVYNINYHVVWSVKYRKHIITPEIEQYMKDLVQDIATDKGFTVHLFEAGEQDHIHCFVSAPPKLSISYIVKMLKGITGRKLFEKFPDIRSQLWKGELWNHSYYVETVGSVSEETIRQYIMKQSKAY